MKQYLSVQNWNFFGNQKTKRKITTTVWKISKFRKTVESKLSFSEQTQKNKQVHWKQNYPLEFESFEYTELRQVRSGVAITDTEGGSWNSGIRTTLEIIAR